MLGLSALSPDVAYFAPVGDAQLATVLGDCPDVDVHGKRLKTRRPGPKRLLMVQHEIAEVLEKAGIEHSSLADRLTDSWDENFYKKLVQHETITVNCCLS